MARSSERSVAAVAVIVVAIIAAESKRHDATKGCVFPSDWEGIWFQSGVRPYITVTAESVSSKGTCVHRAGDKFIVKEVSRHWDWEGIWFQSGVRPYITVTAESVSSKGTCVHRAGDKFIVKEGKNCYKCIVFHQRARNVLQYKESFTCSSSSSPLEAVCGSIAGDANLYSMFRVDGSAVACPFSGPLLFGYDRGKGDCSWPHSEMESCADPTRMALHYQACPNVQASEMMTEELECQAVWKDGAFHYMVAKLWHAHAATDEDKFRCFVLDHVANNNNNNNNNNNRNASSPVLFMAQSGDATCNGLMSPREGSRTLTFTRGHSKVGCSFPSWLTSGRDWRTLDSARSVSIVADAHNASFVTMEARSSVGVSGTAEAEHSSLACHHREAVDAADAAEATERIVLFQTTGCKNGYVCCELTVKSPAVMMLKMGEPSRTREYACDSQHFADDIQPILLVASRRSSLSLSSSSFSLPSAALPFSGVFSADAAIRTQLAAHVGGAGGVARRTQGVVHQDAQSASAASVVSAVLPWAEVCADGHTRREVVAVAACNVNAADVDKRDDFRISSTCHEDSDLNRRFICTHKWSEGDMQYLILQPQSRSSSQSEELLCLGVLLKASDPAHVAVVKLDDNCAMGSSGNNGNNGNNGSEGQGHGVLTLKGDCSYSVGRSARLGQAGQDKLFIILFNLSLYLAKRAAARPL